MDMLPTSRRHQPAAVRSSGFTGFVQVVVCVPLIGVVVRSQPTG